MAIRFKFILTFAFITHVSAINLNFFTFNKPLEKNSSKLQTQPAELILPTVKTVQTSSQTNIIIQPTSPKSDKIISNIKHELENETEGPDASPENSNGNVSDIIPPGQEIDETKVTSSYLVNEDSDEESKSTKNKFSVWQYLPSLPNKFLKLPKIPKQKTTTFTTTIISHSTIFETIHPSCIKLKNVKSMCDGTLQTIKPTVTFHSPTVQETKSLQPENVINKRSVEEITEIFETTSFSNLREMLEPSELDNNYEYLKPEDYRNITPHPEKFLDYARPSSFIESLIASEPKVEFVTEFVTRTKIQKVTDNLVTATVIAHNCLPYNINLEPCHSKRPTIPIIPVISYHKHESENTKIDRPTEKMKIPKTDLPTEKMKIPKTDLFTEKMKIPKTDVSTEKIKISKIDFPFKKPEKLPVYTNDKSSIMDKITEYLIINAQRLIWSEPTYEEINFDSDSTIIHSYPLHLVV